MHHRSEREFQSLAAEVDGVAVCHGQRAVADAVVSFEHVDCLCVAHDCQVWKRGAQCLHGAGVVRLHMVDDEIVWRAVVQDFLDLGNLLESVGYFHAVDDCGFVVASHKVGVVRHSVGQRPQSLESCCGAVVCTYIIYTVCYFLCKHSSFIFFVYLCLLHKASILSVILASCGFWQAFQNFLSLISCGR